MKITTANTKSPSYLGRHELFVGTHTGSFKKIDVTSEDPHKQVNLQSIAALNKFSRITALSWGSNDEILIGRANKFVKIYDSKSSEASGSIELLDSPIVGLARCEGRLVAGLGTGKIQIVADTPCVLETGDHMSKMVQCKTNGKLVATGGKERQNNLKVWDLETQKSIFTSKNKPNDYLQLEVPVWDTDVAFADDTNLLTCSKYGYIRRYDTRTQRRPVVEYWQEKENITYNCLATFGDMLYTGSASGIIRAFDHRRLKVIAHTYKGFTGSISDIGIDETGRFMYSACLDRYVRVHCAESTALLYQCYVKSKATKILLRTKEAEAEPQHESDCEFLGEELEEDEKEENDEEAADQDPEFDALFDNMQTIRDGEVDSGEDDEQEVNKKPKSKSKKRKIPVEKSSTKKRKAAKGL